MNTQKRIAILFLFFSLGALRETVRIFTSSDKDITENRSSLIPMAIIGTGIFIITAIFFWRRGKTN